MNTQWDMKKIIGWIIGVVVLVAAMFGLYSWSNQPGKLDGFASCIKDAGATFFGAFWCPHCQEQKKAFGKSQTLLPYVECSTADGRGQTEVCRDANIEGYPTWQFADGSRESGTLSLEALSRKTGCELPVTE